MKIKHLIAVSALTVGLVAAGSFSAYGADTGDPLVAALESQLDANAPLPAAYAVVHGSEVTFGARERANPDTPFVLGSVSKSFTALAVMVAVDRGELSLDAPVTDYLPDFVLASSVGGNPIRISNLLNHTSGISATGCNLDSSTQAASLEARVDQLRSVTPEAGPGEQFSYCNVGFAVLARVLEESSGRPFAEVLQSTVLTPLGMTHSYTDLATAREHGLAEGNTTIFGIPVVSPEYNVQAALADGYVVSTVRDLATYAQFQMGDGKTRDGAQLLSSEAMVEMHRGTIAVPGLEGTELANYAMGWFTGTVDGTSIVSHSGTTNRYHADIVMVPSEQTAVIDVVAGNWLSNAATTGVGATSLLMNQPADVNQMYRIATALLWVFALLLVVTVAVSLRRAQVRRVTKRRPRLLSGPLLLLAAVAAFAVCAVPAVQQLGSLPAAVQFGWSAAPDLLVLELAWPLVLIWLGVRSIVERARLKTQADS